MRRHYRRPTPPTRREAAMPDSRYEVHLHHIGGYAGNIPVAVPASLRGDVCLYLYDANAEAMDVVVSDSSYRRQLNIGRAVFDRDGEIDVRLTYTPSSSSLFPVSKEFVAYWQNGIFETDMCDITPFEQREVKTARVACTTIDSLRRQEGIAVDILSVDAEGAEGHILDGAADALKTSIIGLICEVQFVEYRYGQTSAGDLFAKTSASGFHLVDLQMHPGRFYERVPLGWRSNGCVMSGDLCFYKRLDAITADHPAPAISLLKTALFALLTRRLEHAVAAVQAALAIDADVLERGSEFAYVRLLADIAELYRKEAAVFLPTWTDFYPTYEAGMTHGDVNRGVNAADARRRYFARTGAVGTFLRRAVELSAQDDTPIEALLRRYELNDLAGAVKQRRHWGMGNLLRWLDLLETGRPTTPETLAQKIAQSLS
jgi:FkbM family methyltransferase